MRIPIAMTLLLLVTGLLPATPTLAQSPVEHFNCRGPNATYFGLAGGDGDSFMYADVGRGPGPCHSPDYLWVRTPDGLLLDGVPTWDVDVQVARAGGRVTLTATGTVELDGKPEPVTATWTGDANTGERTTTRYVAESPDGKACTINQTETNYEDAEASLFLQGDSFPFPNAAIGSLERIIICR